MYFNHIKYILIDLKLINIDLLLNKTLKYLIICVGSILAKVAFWDTTVYLWNDYCRAKFVLLCKLYGFSSVCIFRSAVYILIY